MSADLPAPDREDIKSCRAALRAGSATFHAASRLLPPQVQTAATALYAFCRLADDTVDLEEDPREGLVRLRERLDRVYAGDPIDNPADRALAAVVVRHAVPREIPDALLEGFAWDVEGREYDTLDDLSAYAARVAGTVGAMTCLLMDRRQAGMVARACDLGVAMQLTNIARDVGEDARNGRIYLPRAWMREAGIDPDAWLQNPVFDDALAGVVQRLLIAADRLYKRSEIGISRLPISCRPAIQAARLFYAEIGRQLERQGLDSVNRRAVVPGSRRSLLLVRTLSTVLAPRRWTVAPALEATQFLVDAAAHADDSQLLYYKPGWWDFSRRVEWTLDLFVRMGERDRAARPATEASPPRISP